MRHESPTSLYPDFDPVDVVALATLDGFGPVTVREHLESVRSDGQSIDAALGPGVLSAARKLARAHLNAARTIGARCVIDGEPDFPAPLLDLRDPPTHIWTFGDLSLLAAERRIAIVGTRTLTGYGERVARSLGNAFARNGAVVVSGMARGIDSIAHLSAIEAGGTTVAVLGTGVDVAYPASNRPLHRRIRAEGVVISEAPPGMTAHKGSFPRRNRIIAALGQATIVVEAGIMSGALITSDHADTIGRPVGVIPGPIDSPASLGSNLRLRDGAHCLATVADALALIGISEPGKATVRLESDVEETIWKAIERPAANFDVLIARTGLPARVCLETVTSLEVRGLLDCAITGEVRRR